MQSGRLHLRQPGFRRCGGGRRPVDNLTIILDIVPDTREEASQQAGGSLSAGPRRLSVPRADAGWELTGSHRTEQLSEHLLRTALVGAALGSLRRSSAPRCSQRAQPFERFCARGGRPRAQTRRCHGSVQARLLGGAGERRPSDSAALCTVAEADYAGISEGQQKRNQAQSAGRGRSRREPLSRTGCIVHSDNSQSPQNHGAMRHRRPREAVLHPRIQSWLRLQIHHPQQLETGLSGLCRIPPKSDKHSDCEAQLYTEATGLNLQPRHSRSESQDANLRACRRRKTRT